MNLDTELSQEVLAFLPDPHFVLTERGRYVAVFGGADPHYYHDGSGLVGCWLHDVMPKAKADEFLEQIQHALREQRLWIFEYGLSGNDVDVLNADEGPSGEIWFEARIQPLSLMYRGERVVLWTARNISRHYQLEAQLRRMSETDALTGVFNRRKLLNVLMERARLHQRYGRPTAFIMLDIDHFKQINDRFGHMIGDEVLCSISRICLDELREVDLLSRFGGEEFAVLLPDLHLEQARVVAERLRQVVAQTVFCQGGEEVAVTVSIGISCIKATDSGSEDAIKRADDALYEAKRTGRNRVLVAY